MIGMVAIIDSLVFAALWGLVAAGLGADLAVSLAVAIAGFAVAFALFLRLGSRAAIGGQAGAESRFPTPGGPQA